MDATKMPAADPSTRARARTPRMTAVCARDLAQIKADQPEQRRQIAEFLAGGRRGAADEIEYLAVLQPVIGEPLHLAVLVEIDRDHPLVDDALVHEQHFALRALRNVVENFAVQGRH